MLRPLIHFARDAFEIGLPSALQGVKSRSGKRRVKIKIPGVGKVTIRQGDSDYETVRQVFVLKHYEVGNTTVQDTIQQRYDDIIRAGQTPLIVDAGANIGLAALWFTRMYPKARI